MAEHMYYPDLPCWCGGQPAFGIPHDFGAVLHDDPPEYDPEADAADQAEEWAAGQRELAEIEAEEAHDAAGEAWYLGAYGEGGTS